MLTKTSPQEFYNKVSETKRLYTVLLDQSPAYGTNTTLAVAPDINAGKNTAYGYLEPQTSS